MSNYNDDINSGAPQQGRHRRMERYIGMEDTAPIPAQKAQPERPAANVSPYPYAGTGVYRRPVASSPYAANPAAGVQEGQNAPAARSPYAPAAPDPNMQTRQVRAADTQQRPVRQENAQTPTVYDGYERPDDQYLQSDEALLSRRSRSFSRSSQNSDQVQTRMTQTGYQQTVRQQQRPVQNAGYRTARPASQAPAPQEEEERVYQRPQGRTNQRPQVNTAAPARVRPQVHEDELEEEERAGGLPGAVRVVLIVVLIAVLFLAGIYFFLPEGNSGVIGGLNQVKNGISGVVDSVSGLIRPTEAPAQVLSFSCANPDGQVGQTCKFNMTTTKNVTGVGLCDQNGERITSSVTYTGDLGDNGRLWELSAIFEQPYDSLVYASIQQGNNIWINSDQSVPVAYAAPAAPPVAVPAVTDVPQQIIIHQQLETETPEPELTEEPVPTPEPEMDQPSAGPTPYVISPVSPDETAPEGTEDTAGAQTITFTASGLNTGDNPEVQDDPAPAEEPAPEEPVPVQAAAPTAVPKPTAVPEPTFTPMPNLTANGNMSSLQMVNSIYIGGKLQRSFQRETPINALNPGNYSYWEGGVFTFRGDNFRRNAAFGTAEIKEDQMSILWSKELSSLKTSSSTLYGVGWTGQPAIIKWPANVRARMNLNPEQKEISGLREVIFAAQDGKVYFLNLKDGAETRSPISIGYPLKGSVSVYTQGYPIISFGQGISKLAGGKTGPIGHYMYSLLDGSQVMFLNGRQSNDQKQYTTNGAFDGTSLMIQDPDYSKGGDMIIAGENGLLYTVHMNFDWPDTGEDSTLTVTVDDPVYLMSKAKKSEDVRVGIESSVAMYKNYVFFADSYGALRCVDTTNMATVWAADMGDNTDAAIALDFDADGKLWIYTGNTNAYRLGKKDVTIRRVNAMTGETGWTYNISCAQDKASEMAGCKASPVIGENSISNLVFFTVNKVSEGGSKLIALNKDTGETVWEYSMSAEAISSPVAVYNEAGDSWIIQGDQSGLLHMFDARSGVHLSQLDLGGEIQGSPAVYKNILVIGTCSKGNANMYGIELK